MNFTGGKSLVLVPLFLILIAAPYRTIRAADEESTAPAEQESPADVKAVPEAKTIEEDSAPNDQTRGYSRDPSPLKEKASKLLLQQEFTYDPNLLANPFIPFIKPPEPPPPEIPPEVEEEEALPPELQKPLTPLQKMNIGEIEKGLTAIVWGALGRKAIIQDSAGKGYIVGIGTPVGGNAGIVTQIFDDRLVIQQRAWDRKLKRFVPKNAVIKLRKEASG